MPKLNILKAQQGQIFASHTTRQLEKPLSGHNSASISLVNFNLKITVHLKYGQKATRKRKMKEGIDKWIRLEKERKKEREGEGKETRMKRENMKKAWKILGKNRHKKRGKMKKE